MDPARKLRFLQLPETFAICRLSPDDGIPTWAVSGILFSVTRTPNELSIVCPQVNLPERAPADRGWRCLMLEGPFELNEVGVMSVITRPLAAAGISIFAISSYSTDYLLIKEEQLSQAVTALAASGFEVTV
jgi:hypothetical protein